jgi:phosphoglycerol transferase MdoB-like AlkP superfamily enzyme
MRSFMMANGFERFVEQSDFPNPTFVSAWGVCDEDLFSRAIEEFDAMQAVGRPFFSVVLTVSNHKPFTYPDGRIKRPSSEQSRDNAVNYADWALGEFFAHAKDHAFYDNTIFVLMGDHGARVYGSQMFPIKSYRIPVLMIVPPSRFEVGGASRGVPGTRCSTLASSLDIATTIMGLLGGSYESVFYGRDALNISPSTGYALMQHNHDLALLDADGRMTVLGCPNTANSYVLDHDGATLLRKATVDSDQRDDAIAFFQTANRLYYDERYFPDSPSLVAATEELIR